MTIKFGVIGVGVMGQNHARIAYTLPGIKLIGIADADFLRAEDVARKYRAKAYADYHELLPEVDARSLPPPLKPIIRSPKMSSMPASTPSLRSLSPAIPPWLKN